VLVIFVDGETTPAPAPGFRWFGLDLGGTDGGSFRGQVDAAAIIATGCDDAGLFMLIRDGLHAECGCRRRLELHT
jgi:hypothetical protein